MKTYLNPILICQNMKNKTVIFNGKKSSLITLNDSGAFIFNKLLKGYDLKQIAQGLIKKYKINKKEAELDVKQFSTLLKRRMILISG